MIKAILCGFLLVCSSSMAQTDTSANKMPQNIIGFDCTSPLFNELRISYERLLFHENFGVRLSGSGGFPTDLWDNHNLWSAAIDLKYYPFGQLRNSYTLSFMTEVGEYSRIYAPYYYNNGYYENRLYQYVAFYVRNGWVYRPLDHMSFSFVFGLGMRSGDERLSDWERHANLEISVEYRF